MPEPYPSVTQRHRYTATLENPVNHQDTPQQAANASTVTATGIDLTAARLPTNYGASLGVQKVLMSVPVGKPKKGAFFRTREGADWTIDLYIYTHPATGDIYLVMPHVAVHFGDLARAVTLFVAVNRQGDPFLIPVPLPSEDGYRNPWHQSLANAVQHGSSKWIRIAANRHAGAYNVLEAQAVLPDPDWPKETLKQLLAVAFRNRVIDDANHPVVQEVLGQV